MRVVLLIFGALIISCGMDKTEEVASIQLSYTEVFIQIATKFPITATISPTNALTGTIKWSTTSAAVATVDNNGSVTAVSPGITTITATLGEVTATCSVTVAQNVSITCNDD